MKNHLLYYVFISVCLTVISVIGWYNYSVPQTEVVYNEYSSYYAQDSDPCVDIIGLLRNNKFARLPHASSLAEVHNCNISAFSSKDKCIVGNLSGCNCKQQKQIFNANHSTIFHNITLDMVDYYIYALRHIQV